MSTLLGFYATVLLALLALAGLLHLLPRLGRAGRRLSDALCVAPGLDAVIFLFVAAPMLAGVFVPVALGLGLGWGVLFFVAGVAAQITAVCLWTVLHELAHRQEVRQERIVTVLNRKYGRWRNHAAVWWTAWAVPLFVFIRLAEYVVYRPLTLLVRLPKYDDREWVAVSRHKFEGLVGHDRIWCLYCDWMTGVWSLGSEMLRNVESFWCPIRFASPEKCANCRTDFPDVAGGWVPADGTMADVVRTLDEKYPAPNGDSPWFGHPVRLTVGGRPTAPAPAEHPTTAGE